MRTDRQLQRLQAVPLFVDLTQRELREIRRVARDMEFREGDSIVNEGMIGDDFYLILEGEARVTKGGKQVRTLAPGDYFGEIAFILGLPRTASVTATTRVVALRLDSAGLTSVLDTMPSIARKVLTQVTRRLVELEASITD